MLIELAVTNFRSFREKQVFSMVAANYPDHIETNTFDPNAKGFPRLLRSSAIYGPNAAGKTNLLRALQFVQSLVVNSATAGASAASPYSPFKLAAVSRETPSEFEVAFIQDKVRYSYGFTISASRIESEWLIEYANPRGRLMFDRTYNQNSGAYDWKFSNFFKGQRSVWSESTRPDALFLSTATQLNSTQLRPVFDWFAKRLVVIVGVTTMNPTLTLTLLDQPHGKDTLLPFLQEADLGVADLEVTREPIPAGSLVLSGSHMIVEQKPGQQVSNLVKVTLSHWSDQDQKVGLDFSEESNGTQILFRSAGAWLNVFSNGEVLLFDELDTSLHPLITKYLIKRFHSDATNPNNSQLIFTTHNTSLLSQDIFRRDQIWFAEKDRSGASTLSPLADFNVRNDEVLERNYLRGKYGALPILNEPQR